MRSRRPSIRGFTLVELSIVLVIIGLLTGGVLTGQSLIHAAELRSVSVDYSKYKAAVYTFRDKYFAIPGDMTNATQYWGSLGGTGADATCQAIAATGTATCNGDGGGNLLSTSGVAQAETYRFWQHLANAGLIEGAYSGIQNPTAPFIVPGTNVPASRLGSGVYWSAAYQGPSGYFTATANYFGGYYGNYFAVNRVGGAIATANSLPLKPEDAYNIDVKLDDGKPGSGIVIPIKGNGTATFCTSAAGNASDAGATYQLTNTNKDCLLYIVLF